MRFLLFVLLAFFVNSLIAADVVESKGMTVYGNQETPKGLVLVPWQMQKPDVKIDTFAFSVANDVFRPLDRKSFLRQVDYYQQIFRQDKPAK